MYILVLIDFHFGASPDETKGWFVFLGSLCSLQLPGPDWVPWRHRGNGKYSSFTWRSRFLFPSCSKFTVNLWKWRRILLSSALGNKFKPKNVSDSWSLQTFRHIFLFAFLRRLIRSTANTRIFLLDKSTTKDAPNTATPPSRWEQEPHLRLLTHDLWFLVRLLVKWKPQLVSRRQINYKGHRHRQRVFVLQGIIFPSPRKPGTRSNPTIFIWNVSG